MVGDGDADGDNEVVIGTGSPFSTINWYKNDVHQSGLQDFYEIPSGFTSCNEEWYVVVTPSDGTVFGESYTSNTVTFFGVTKFLSVIYP